jgi:uncharacterized protein YlxP (DUF503 family)
MTVGFARLTLFLPGAHSLKEKRMVLRRLKDRSAQKFGVPLAEVGDNDLWQRAQVGFAVVGNDRRFVDSVVDEMIRFARELVEVTDVEREIQTLGDRFGENTLGFEIP